MLPFGSITSLVPLSILAFAYLVYLSVSVLNKNIPESSKTIRQSEISISSDSDNNYRVTYPDFRHHQNDTDDHAVFPGNFYFRDNVGLFFHEIVYGELISPQCVSPFSPRPPPTV
jgi:hypothetical protein